MGAPSGRFVLRLPPALHAGLRNTAARRGLSLNQCCVELLNHELQDLHAISDLEQPVGGNMVPAGVLQRIRKAYGRALEGVILFGSAARERLWESSDIDLLIVLRPDTPIERQLYRIWDDRLAHESNLLPHPIAAQFVALPERVEQAGGIWFEVALEGVVLVDPQLRLSHLIALLRQEILAGRVVRKFVHGQPYWVKPRSTKGKAA